MSPEAKPHVFAHATGAAVLETETRNLDANLAEIIRYACVRSDTLAAAATELGVTAPELIDLAARYGIRLPWRAR